MKYLLFLLPFTCYALTNYVPEIKNNKTYTDQGICQADSGQTCYAFDSSVDVEVMEVKEVEVDDTSKPIYASKTNETYCILTEGVDKPENDCTQLIVKNESNEYVLCTDKSYFAVYALKANFNLGEGYFAYCTKLTGYQKKNEKQLVEDNSLKAIKQASIDSAKAMAKAERSISFGRKVIAMAWVISSSKNLTIQQTAELNVALAPIVMLLNTGSIETAYGAISTLSNEYVTQADKDAMLAEINKFLQEESNVGN
jgi:hypothetical protein